MGYQDVIDFVGAEVGRMERGAVEAMLPILDAAQRELTRDLNGWLAKHTDGSERFTALKYRQSLASIKSTLAEIQRIEPRLFQTLLGSSHSAGNLAIGHLMREVEMFSLLYQGEARSPAINAAAILAQGRGQLIPRHRTSAHRYTGQVATDIKAQLAIGVVRGESMDQLVNRLVRLGGPKGPVALRGILGEPGALVESISEGLFSRYRHWAERVARTEVLHAYNLHAHEGLGDLAEDDPEMQKRWDASLDSRLCTLCQGLHGQTVKIKKAGGGTENFPGGFPHPPAHPMCRCAVVAWHADWAGPSEGVTMLPDGGAEADFAFPEPPRAARPVVPRPVVPRPVVPRPVVNWEGLDDQTAGQIGFVRLAKSNPQLYDQFFGPTAPRFLKDRDLAEMLKILNGGTDIAPVTMAQAKFAWERYLRIEKALAAVRKWEEKHDPVTKARIKAEKAEAKKAEAKKARDARAQEAERKRLATLGKLDGLAAVKAAKERPIETVMPENAALLSSISAADVTAFEKAMLELTGEPLTVAELCHGFNPGPNARMVVTRLGASNRNPSISFEIYDKATGRKMNEDNITRDFHERGGKIFVHHAFLRLGKDFQDNGAAKIINGNALLRYEKWGMQGANVNAAWVGRHAWASMGFTFDHPAEMAQSFERYLARVGRGWTPARRAEVLADGIEAMKKPWIFSAFSIPEGRFPDEYNRKPMAGGFEVGKAFLLSPNVGMWDGTLPIGKGNEGYEHALSLLKVWDRL